MSTKSISSASGSLTMERSISTRKTIVRNTTALSVWPIILISMIFSTRMWQVFMSVPNGRSTRGCRSMLRQRVNTITTNISTTGILSLSSERLTTRPLKAYSNSISTPSAFIHHIGNCMAVRATSTTTRQLSVIQSCNRISNMTRSSTIF